MCFYDSCSFFLTHIFLLSLGHTRLLPADSCAEGSLPARLLGRPSAVLGIKLIGCMRGFPLDCPSSSLL